MLRRFVLGLVVALVVARPLVQGEDPGLIAGQMSHPLSLTFIALWLLAAVGGAVWRYRAQLPWRGSGVDVALAATVLCVVASAAFAARYKHPAWLISWEWFVLLVAFCLVRQLARAPGDTRGVLAALLATGVTLSAYGIYQYVVEFPRARAEFADSTSLRRELANQSVFLDTESEFHLPEDAAALLTATTFTGSLANLPWGPLVQAVEPNAAEPDFRLALWQERIEAANVFATYAHPNSFAGFLALLLPAVVGLAWMSGTGVTSPFRYGPFLAALFAFLVAAALWLTHSRGALLGVLVAAVAAAFVLGRAAVQRHVLKVGLIVGLLVVASVWVVQSGWLGTLTGKDTATSARRLEYWRITASMIADHPWLGVGPGNFGRSYPRYMPAAAFEKLQDPHNFVLELWATCGVLGALALLAAFGLFFRRIWQARNTSEEVLAAEDTPESFIKLRWEFYLGGVGGLLLGFVIRAASLEPQYILMEGVLAGMRSLLWFAAFAVLDGVLWRGSLRPFVLAAGVLALLVNLLVSGGIGLPAVAQPLWIVIALALNAAAPVRMAEEPIQSSWLRRFAPIPVLAVIWFAYLMLTHFPVIKATNQVLQARASYLEWTGKREPYWRYRILTSDKPDVRHQAGVQANRFLEPNILELLNQAVLEDPGEAAHWAELAHWRGERWKLFPTNKELAQDALNAAAEGARRDPEGKLALQGTYRLRRLFAHTLLERGDPSKAPEQFGLAAAALGELVKRDPNDARLRFHHAETLLRAGEVVQGKTAAAEALKLHDQGKERSRRLTDRQRRQAERWLASPGKK